MKSLVFPNKTLKSVYFIFLPLLIFVVFLVFWFLNFFLNFWIVNNKILPVSFSVSSETRLPIIKTEFVPQVSAKGAIIMDADSKVVLYSKNPDLRFSTASTAKIMTALTAVDYFRPQDILTVQNATNEGSVLGLKQGEKFTFENLLYAMLLPSANDAALTISQNYPGSEVAFVEKMNEKAKLLNLYNTSYADPAGLIDSGDYTTPFDLARLASFAIKNPEIKKIVGTKETVISDTYGNVIPLENLNKLLGIDGVNGVKTGFTGEAGEVLVTSKLEKGKTIIIVVMGSDDRFLDTQNLLELVSNNLSFLSIHP
jgi:D-alanyl-D-alanine carboxypeptidase